MPPTSFSLRSIKRLDSAIRRGASSLRRFRADGKTPSSSQAHLTGRAAANELLRAGDSSISSRHWPCPASRAVGTVAVLAGAEPPRPPGCPPPTVVLGSVEV